MAEIIQNSPKLREQRKFPYPDVKLLANEIDRAYIDIATKVNDRTIGTFAKDSQIVTGENWFISNNKRQQTLRKVFTFGAIAPGTEKDIPIDIPSFSQFTRIYGTIITNVPDYRPLPYVDPITLTTSMALLVGPIAGINNIRIVLGNTAPPVTSGIVVLEYLST